MEALRGIDLEIAEGEFVAIVGPSGGGKTTLMNILGLLDEPTAGEYILDGQPVRAGDGKRAAAVRSKTIGFVFQAFHLLDARPAIDSVELNLLYRGVPRDQRDEDARAALAIVGLGDKAHQNTSQLSGGQRQRVAIARAIAADARLILADEPTGNLDSHNAEQILDELDRINQSGTTVVVVTHAPEVAARARRVVRIADGRLVSDDAQTSTSNPTSASLAEPVGTRPSPTSAQALSDGAANDRTEDEFEQLLRAREAGVDGQGTELPQRTRVRIADVLRDAWASVLSRRFQTLGQCFAVAIAVALTITTLGLASSARAQVSATFDAHLNREVTAKWSTGVAHSPPLGDVPQIAGQLRGVDAAAVILDLAPGVVSTFSDARQVRAHIAIGDIAAAARLTITEAPWHHGPLLASEVYVGDLLAKQLQLGPLSGAPAITVGGTSYAVAGIITESSRLPLLRGEVISGPPDIDPSSLGPISVNLLVITAAGGAQQVAKQLPAAVNPFQPDAISVSAPTDSKQLRGQVEQGVQATLTAFTLLALVVAIAALMNATLLAVNARRGEIGMRKALGARDYHIGTLITVESAYIGILGGVAGLLLGMIAILVVTISQRWSPVFDLALMPLALGIGLLVGAGGGGLASIRAARLRPADNLRS